MMRIKEGGKVLHSMPLSRFWEDIIPKVGGVQMIPGFRVRIGAEISAELDLDKFANEATVLAGQKLAELLGDPVREYLREGGYITAFKP